jgi:hypothetical protein
VFTDNGSKDLKLKTEILRLKKKKELEIYIVLTPDYEGRPNDESLRVFFYLAKAQSGKGKVLQPNNGVLLALDLVIGCFVKRLFCRLGSSMGRLRSRMGLTGIQYGVNWVDWVMG